MVDMEQVSYTELDEAAGKYAWDVAGCYGDEFEEAFEDFQAAWWEEGDEKYDARLDR